MIVSERQQAFYPGVYRGVIYISCIYAGVDGLDLILKARQQSTISPLGLSIFRHLGVLVQKRKEKHGGEEESH